MKNKDGTVIFRADNIIIQGRLVDGRGRLVEPFTIDKKIEWVRGIRIKVPPGDNYRLGVELNMKLIPYWESYEKDKSEA